MSCLNQDRGEEGLAEWYLGGIVYPSGIPDLQIRIRLRLGCLVGIS